ncbi:MAG TPA: CocE/NonD family hydrolase [Bryobacteraceae bacterium]|nr:CocE/NonD family hydrolase [Bryobacteraceae bacterium]
MRVLPACCILCSLIASAASLPPARLKNLNLRVAMRDGVRLSTNVFRPDVKTRVPTVLVRTPYGKGADLAPTYEPFIQRGYAVVLQDVRGRYASGGVFQPFSQEGPDGYDTLDWIAAQPWSDGKVGMIGGSYLGIAQWKVALHNNPHLKAISPVVSGYDDYRDRFYSPGGAMKLGHRLLWMSLNLTAPGFTPPAFDRFVLHLPLRTSDRAATGKTSEMWQRSAEHPAYDSFWRSMSVRAQIDRVHVPSLAFGGWYDNFAQSDLEAYSALKAAAEPHRVVIGPWPHNMSIKFPGADFGAHSSMPVRAMQLDWMDYWLKGKSSALIASAPVKIFVMGADEWREEREWPLARARPTRYYLSAAKAANSIEGDGRLSSRPPAQQPSDQFVFDPRNPVPTRGGSVCCNPAVFPWGPLDQRPVERRPDVLVYTSHALRKDLEVTGPVRVVLHVSTSAPDTDFTAKLVDVFPDGEARHLTDGILRLRYRDSLEKAAPATPGKIYRISIDAGVTSNVFRKGHRIRLEVSSSNFPRFDRNPNTGRPVIDETELRKASQTVYHDRSRESYVLLPVIPRK